MRIEASFSLLPLPSLLSFVNMKLEFTLEREDFLAFQLFEADHSARIQKKLRNGRTYIVALFFLLSFLGFISGNNGFALAYLFTGLIFLAAYPRYFKWRYKKHYTQFIDDNYTARFGLLSSIEFKSDAIALEDKTGSALLKMEELKSIAETKEHLFIKVSTGNSLIVPKRFETESQEVLRALLEQDVPYLNLKDWQW